MENQIDLVLGEDAVEDLRVEDGAVDVLADKRCQLRRQRIEIERDDRLRAVGGQARDEAVTDLAAGAGDEGDGFAHGQNRGPWSVIRGPWKDCTDRDGRVPRS